MLWVTLVLGILVTGGLGNEDFDEITMLMNMKKIFKEGNFLCKFKLGLQFKNTISHILNGP